MAFKPPKPSSSGDKPAQAAGPDASSFDDKLAIPVGSVPGTKPVVTKPPVAAKPPRPPDDGDDDDDDDALEIDDDEEDEDLVVFTAREAAGALATIYGFVRPFLKKHRKILAFVGLGVLVETLFNVIMPLSLKYLIDDALGEEDFEALVTILSVLAVAGLFSPTVAVWYERWDAKLSASLISDVRERLFGPVPDLPPAYFPLTPHR